MDGDPVSQCHHAQVTLQFGNIDPVTNPAIFGLYLAPDGKAHSLPAPIELDVRPLGQHLLAKVIRYG